MLIENVSVDDEYKKNKDLKREDVDKILEWLHKQPHLPTITEYEIIIFLHSCYYKLEATKTTIETYYTVRTHCPEFFDNRFPNGKLPKGTDIGLYSVLGTTTSDKYRVLYCRLIDFESSKYDFNEQVKLLSMVTECLALRDGTVPGFVMVMDMAGGTLGHFAKVPLAGLKKFFVYLQEAMPIRLKSCHAINLVPFIDKIMTLIKPFMKKELYDSIHLHTSNLETLYEFIPKKCLPKDLGGESPSYNELHNEMNQMLLENADYFKEEGKQRVDESKRLGRPTNAGQLFGMEGSFKKLDID